MKKKLSVILLPFATFFLCYYVSAVFVKMMFTVRYVCPARYLTGMYCPGCGATRALNSLLKLDFISSLKYNPIILIACVLLVLWYLQVFLSTFGSKKRIFPSEKKFYYISGSILFFYLLIRNFIPALQPV